MPDFVCVQCFSCHTFQVQQVKKSRKFACKLCGAKQSVRKVFTLSPHAKHVRHMVQALNLARGRLEQEGGGEFPTGAVESHQASRSEPVQERVATGSSQVDWSDFTPKDEADWNSDQSDLAGNDRTDADGMVYTTILPDRIGKKRRRVQRADWTVSRDGPKSRKGMSILSSASPTLKEGPVWRAGRSCIRVQGRGHNESADTRPWGGSESTAGGGTSSDIQRLEAVERGFRAVGSRSSSCNRASEENFHTCQRREMTARGPPVGDSVEAFLNKSKWTDRANLPELNGHTVGQVPGDVERVPVAGNFTSGSPCNKQGVTVQSALRGSNSSEPRALDQPGHMHTGLESSDGTLTHSHADNLQRRTARGENENSMWSAFLDTGHSFAADGGLWEECAADFSGSEGVHHRWNDARKPAATVHLQDTCAAFVTDLD